MKNITILCLILISNIAHSSKAYLYALNSQLTLMILIPNDQEIDVAISVRGNQILIQEGVIIQLFPNNSEYEINISSNLRDVFSYFLTGWIRRGRQDTIENLNEPLSAVIPAYEGPATLPIFKQTIHKLCSFGCGKEIERNNKASHINNFHNKQYKIIRDKCNSVFFCSFCKTCMRPIDSLHALSMHIRFFHPEKNYIDFLP